MRFIGFSVVIYVVSTAKLNQAIEISSRTRPMNVAHRGSSGALPEHTVEAYKLAVQQGADAIECDLYLTKDLKLICTHEPQLNETTDVHEHEEFRNRVATNYFKGEAITDYFVPDFTLNELMTLKRKQQFQARDQSYNGLYSIATFDDFVAVAQNSSNPKPIGILIEIKIPSIANIILQPFSLKIEDIVLAALKKHGYTNKDDACIIQCFDIASLEYIAGKTDMKLMYLSDDNISDDDLRKYRSIVSHLGVQRRVIVATNPATRKVVTVTDFVEKAHGFGYKVFPYTFMNELLAFDYEHDPYQEYERFYSLGVDGFFTDYPFTLANFLKQKECEKKSLMGRIIEFMHYVLRKKLV